MNDEFDLQPLPAAEQSGYSTQLPLRRFALFLLRLVSGFIFAIHGAQLIFGLLGGSDARPQTPFTLLWFAGVLEFFGGLLVTLGLFTRPVAFVLSGEMAIAFFRAHFPQGWNPTLNGGEPAVLFCFIFLYLANAGPGALSVGRIIARARKR